MRKHVGGYWGRVMLAAVTHFLKISAAAPASDEVLAALSEGDLVVGHDGRTVGCATPREGEAK